MIALRKATDDGTVPVEVSKEVAEAALLLDPPAELRAHLYAELARDRRPHTVGTDRPRGSQLAHRMKLYTTPELRFVYDESVERGDRLSRLIDSVVPPRR